MMLTVIDSEKMTIINLADFAAVLKVDIYQKGSTPELMWHFTSNYCPDISYDSESFKTRREAIEWMRSVIEIGEADLGSAKYSLAAEVEMIEDEEDIPKGVECTA